MVDSAEKALLREKEQEERNKLVRQNMDLINVKLAEMQMSVTSGVHCFCLCYKPKEYCLTMSLESCYFQKRGHKKRKGLRRLLHAVQHLQQMMEMEMRPGLKTGSPQQRHRARDTGHDCSKECTDQHTHPLSYSSLYFYFYSSNMI